jgi:hypothetical protein
VHYPFQREALVISGSLKSAQKDRVRVKCVFFSPALHSPCHTHPQRKLCLKKERREKKNFALFL